jgi:hypothetical protein
MAAIQSVRRLLVSCLPCSEQIRKRDFGLKAARGLRRALGGNYVLVGFPHLSCSSPGRSFHLIPRKYHLEVELGGFSLMYPNPAEGRWRLPWTTDSSLTWEETESEFFSGIMLRIVPVFRGPKGQAPAVVDAFGLAAATLLVR